MQNRSFKTFFKRILAMAKKEVFHILRDSRTIAISLGMPVVLIVLFGFGVSFDFVDIPIAYVDYSNTNTSQKFIEGFFASKEFIPVAKLVDPEKSEQFFRSNSAWSTLVIPPNFAQKIARSETASLQFLLDGSDGTIAQAVLGNGVSIAGAQLSKIIPNFGANLTSNSPSNSSAALPVSADISYAFNPGLRSAVFFVPGLIGLIMAIAAVLLTALTIAREWERGNMEQLFATPVTCLEIILGKLLPYLALGMAQGTLVIIAGTTIFDVQIVGSIFTLTLGMLIFLCGMLGQGLLISVVTKNQQVATMAGALSTLLPTILLSGFVFPISNMPYVLQIIASIFPSRYIIEILRGVILKGNGIFELKVQFLAISIFAVVIIALATKKFQRKVA